MLVLSTLLAGVLATPTFAVDTNHIYASARTGDDEAGDGSEATPFRSVSRCLDLIARAPGSWFVHVDIGRYDASTGETLPWRIPAGTRLRGLTSDRTVVEAPGLEFAAEILSGEGAVHLSDLRFVGSEIGVIVRPRATPTDVQLTNLWLDKCTTGIEVEPAREERHAGLEARRCRFTECAVGIHAGGAGRLELGLLDCSFRDGAIGFALEGPEGDAALDHRILLSQCDFDRCTDAGMARTGEGTPGPEPIRLEDTHFEGCRFGLRLELPSGDHPFLIQRCRFEHNEMFGARIIGKEGDPEGVSIVEDCLFRWNGIGIQLFNSALPILIQRTRAMDNLGAAISLGSVLGNPAKITIAHSLLVNNGAAGIYSLSDQRNVTVRVFQCTIANNHAAGIERRVRRGGETTFQVRNCILAGNRGNLIKIAPASIAHCLLDAEHSEPLADHCLVGDPEFVDPDRGDFRLRKTSPAIDKAGPKNEIECTPADLDGRPVATDLGALQSIQSTNDD